MREAFHTFALRYHPDRFARAPTEKRERASQIYRRGAEAYRVLMDGELRRRYDVGLRHGDLRLTDAAERKERVKSRTQSTKLGVRSSKARPFVSQAQRAFKLGDFKTAKLNLKMALAHEPANPLIRARLAAVEEQLRGH